jgi:heme peroxidase
MDAPRLVIVRRRRRKLGRLRRLFNATAIALAVGEVVRRAIQGPGGRYSYTPSLAAQIFGHLAVWIDQHVGWPNMPLPFGLIVLLGERIMLRWQNLHDTNVLPTTPLPDLKAENTDYLTHRTIDGTFNDLRDPRMGSAGTRFGRNVPSVYTSPDPEPEVYQPNPRTISLELLTRDNFVPATSLNMLAAAWIQFMTRDWFTHGTGDKNNMWQIPLPPGDNFPQNPMLIPKTIPDPTRPPGTENAGPPTHINLQTPWWDASQLYPTDASLLTSIRTGTSGKLRLEVQNGEEHLPAPLLDHLAQLPGWWLGLGLLLTLFAREHNAICDRLASAYPGWSDEQLFQQARLINAALMAKIHTVEWTPAIIAHPTTVYALRGNWWGIGGQQLSPLLRRISDDEIVRGIPGTPTEHHNAPYSLTEEFVAVYRMHPLIRDDYSFRRAADDGSIEQRTFDQVTDVKGNQLLASVPMSDLLYSFGTLYPGALQLHNYPKLLQHFTRPDGKIADLAAIDIMRMREFGVPRYTLFRELLHLKPVRHFEDVTDNTDWVRQMREVYDGRVDRLDLMIGMFAEPKPTGFGFSDTAFRIFILMASRRLKSDRFFGLDYTPEVYTPEGMDWVENSTMGDVLARHYPTLRGVANPDNAFAPWPGTRA